MSVAARDEKEWSVESSASESSTASASKRRRRTTAVAVEPHIEVRFSRLLYGRHFASERNVDVRSCHVTRLAQMEA